MTKSCSQDTLRVNDKNLHAGLSKPGKSYYYLSKPGKSYSMIKTRENAF